MDRNIGKKLDGRYEISELIGIGGMADVYRATDIMEDKVVAVKILKNEFSGNDEFLRRFRNESKAIAVLSHPNIVKIFDVGFTDKIQYIVMEYIDGITLKEFIEQQGVLKWKDAVHFTVQVLRALQHAHDRGIVHRDIKPQNIMLFPDGTIKVMDFGIARFAREDGKTLSDKTIGSVHYISPEQARGDITDEKSDIYSVGAMLYEMLTGQKPFDADTPVAVALMHMQENAKMPREIVDSIPESLEEIVMHAMQKDASKRYQSASEMVKDIEAFKQNPAIVFGYNNANELNDGATIYFNPIAKANSDDGDLDFDEEDEDDEEETKPSLFVPIFTAVTIAVVVVAALIISLILLKGLNVDKNKVTMDNLIGQEYSTFVSDKYRIEVESEEYSTEYEKGIIFWQEKPAGREIVQDEVIKVKVSKGIQVVTVPRISTSTTFESAEANLKTLGFKVKRKNQFDDKVMEGYVIKTEPGEYEEVAFGSEVLVIVSNGPTTKTKKVPDVLNMTEAEAKKMLTAYDLMPLVVPYPSPDNAGKVASQLPEKDAYVDRGSVVKIWVSTGQVVDSEFALNLDIPAGTEGSYIIDCYILGNKATSTTLERADLSSVFPIKITSSGKQLVTVEVTNTITKKAVKYAEYNINFIDGVIIDNPFLDKDAFKKSATLTTTFNVDGAVTNVDTIAGTAIQKPADPKKDGNTFKGWFTSASGGTQVTEFTKTQTVYAQWTKNNEKFTVKFDVDGIINNVETNVGTAITMPPNPTKDGFTFKGWFTSANDGTKVTDFTTAKTVYAQWE